MSRARPLVVMLALVGGCPAEGGQPIDGGDLPDRALPVMDSGADDAELDAGADDAGSDAGEVDAGGMDAGGSDAGGSDAAGTDGAADAGRPIITIDGVVSDAEWAGATTVDNTVATTWGAGLNELDRLRVLVDATDLYIAVEGVVETTNAIVVYVDRAFGVVEGICDIMTLSDTSGALDNSISPTTVTTPAGFCVDFAFGSRRMSHVASGDDPDLGWRDVATDRADFHWIGAAVAPAACGADACETRYPLADLGSASGDTLALFVRILNSDGSMLSNQCLPEDAPTSPQVVSRLLEIDVP